jgi:peptidoglycan hydrolase-like protein with peptidoglycan-binding domain
MIQLGCFDSGVPDSECQAYLKTVEQLTRLAIAQVNAGPDRVTLERYTPEPQAMTVKEVQQGLKTAGFFTAGQVDGICGYRTQSALRLFQEYVRTYEKQADMIPDGRFGPKSQAHLRRWLAGGLKSEWMPVMEQWQAGSLGDSEYTRWIALLEKAKQRYLAQPGPGIAKVNAFTGATGTHKVADWDFSPRAGAHLVGIRREEATGKSDDVFVLLLKGLVFKFQGSTEPGAAKDPAMGFPFLLIGQHDYHFGWHHATYLALRPQPNVLVVRSKDREFRDADLASPLEPNSTINIHWGGRGLLGDLNDWSEGCQVVSGSVYMNPRQELIDCRAFMGIKSDDPIKNPDKTRGAYNVLVDLVTALSSDQSATLKYTLIAEADLDLDPALKANVADARTRVLAVAQ